MGFGKDAWDAFDALFPTITATGVPKRAALSASARLESSPRELYSCAILWLDGPLHSSRRK
ncbi:MAG: chorismate-binding protein [Symbiopectobacterium sp.]